MQDQTFVMKYYPLVPRSGMQKTHLINRVSPRGESFVGTCALCGKTGLKINDVHEACDNPVGVSINDAILTAIIGVGE